MQNIEIHGGLNSEEVVRSRLKFGANELAEKKKKTFFGQFMGNFGDPIIRILLIALAVNLLYLIRDFDWYESAGIAVAILLATFVATLSEHGSESAFAKLQEDAGKIKCRVRRVGQTANLPIGEIVVGDIVLLQSGEKVPADGVVVGGEFCVDQSSLNGESKEARKNPVNKNYGKYFEKNLKQTTADFLSEDKVFRGSTVSSGEGVVKVIAVGDKTVYGALAWEVQGDTIESPLKGKLRHLAKVISRFGYLAALLAALAKIFYNIVIQNSFNPEQISQYLSNTSVLIGDLIAAFMLGLTVVVMAVPEGLPMMITVVLSSNMKRMLKDNVLVRKLVGIETSGAINILFTDKTGTLTKGQLDVVTFLDGGGKLHGSLSILRKNKEAFKMVTLNCFHNNSAEFSAKNIPIGGNSTDRALLRFIKTEVKTLPKCERVSFTPFNSSDKFSVCQVKGEENATFIKGAPEKLLANCTTYLDKNGRKVPFKAKSAFLNEMNSLTNNAMRLIALCVGENSKNHTNLTLVGLVGIKDELRKEAAEAVNSVQNAGVQVVMITGDNKNTAVAIAKDCKIVRREDENKRFILTSTELNALNDDELKKILPEIRVIARALPSDKSRLVRISQELDLVAGMTGDGVNDAPALKRADVGFAMGAGTEVAKEAGDIVILDNNFSSIVKAVLYGRTIFKSIRKFIIFQLTVNLCAVLVSIVGPFIGIPTPVTVIQMLWINMIMDTLAGLAFAGEPPLKDYMREKPKKRDEPIISRGMWGQIILGGLYTTAMCIAFLSIPGVRNFFGVHFMTAFFALFIFAGIFNSLTARSPTVNILRGLRRNRAFMFIMAAIVAIQLGMIYYGGTVFRTMGLTFRELVLVVSLAFSVIIADAVRKLMMRHLRNHRKSKVLVKRIKTKRV